MNTPLSDEIDVEVAIDSDGGGTDKTEVLEDDELTADNPQGGYHAQSVDNKKIQREPFGGHSKKILMEQTEAIADNKTSSGESFIHY